MTPQETPPNPLLALLRMMTEEEQNDFAQLAGTKRGYLYQIAGGHRPNISLAMAIGIEDASRQIHASSNKKFPVITARQLHQMFTVSGLQSAG